MYNTNNSKKILTILPVRSYDNPGFQKQQIYKDNINKTGIYIWTNHVTHKSYVGSSSNLSLRFKNYFNSSYLKREIKKSKSLIYRALLKYGYSSFKLDIIEYCDPTVVIKREQYYLDNLISEYNILKVARSSLRFKHSVVSTERIRAAKLGYTHDEATKLKLSSNKQAHAIRVIDISTGEIKLFTSIRKTAKFMGMNYSYLAKCLKENKLYVGKGYSIVKIN